MNPRSLFYLFGIALMTNISGAQTYAQHVDRVRQAYSASSWPMGVVRDGLPLATLTPLGMRSAEPKLSGRFVVLDFRPPEAPVSARPTIRLEAGIFPTAAEAHETLVDWLASLSSAALAPEDGSFGVELGEAGYVGPSGIAEGAVSWVAFVRGNVAMRLLNLDLVGFPELDLVAAAREVDAAALARPALSTGAGLRGPVITRLKAGPAAVVAGDKVVLDAIVTDPGGLEATLRFAVGGTGQGFVERHPDGWYLFTTGRGEVIVTLVAIGSNGMTAEKTVTVEVADDD